MDWSGMEVNVRANEFECEFAWVCVGEKKKLKQKQQPRD